MTQVPIPPFLHGLHESGGEVMLEANKPGWVLELAAIGIDDWRGANRNWRGLADRGLGVIVRVNNGYHPGGTLPEPQHYETFAVNFANYVANTVGCHIWIVGNEPNHAQEFPNGQWIFPGQYGVCYALVHKFVHSIRGHENDLVLMAGTAPWNPTVKYEGNMKGDWITYFEDSISAAEQAGVQPDGFAIHTATHGTQDNQFHADMYMDAADFRHRRVEFRTYIDYMEAIKRKGYAGKFTVITEMNPVEPGWPDGATNWVVNAYEDLAWWNRTHPDQPISGAMLYRWPNMEGQAQWAISTRPGVIDNFKAAMRSVDTRMPKAPQQSLPFKQYLVQVIGDKPASTGESQLASITAPAGLNIRNGPSTDNEIEFALPFGTMVHVTGRVSDSEWWFIELWDQGKLIGDGWGHSAYLKLATEEEPRSELIPDKLIPVVDSDNAAKRAVARIWNNYGGYIQRKAQNLAMPLEIAVATIAAESGGNPDVIRFEAHILFNLWAKTEQQADRFRQHFRYNYKEPWKHQMWRALSSGNWLEMHTNQASERTVLQFAANAFDPHAAYQSISMGLPQIMGFHYKLMGYSTPMEMYQAFFTGSNYIQTQLDGMFKFIESKGLLDELQRGDLRGFAAGYNGPGQADLYGAIIKQYAAVFLSLYNA